MSNAGLHTILGANGAVGRAVIKELSKRNIPVRAVSRKSSIAGLENKNADLLDAQQTLEAIAGSAVVYLCIGLPYRTKVWKTQWETVMSNVIEACSVHQAKLVYLDNIYMYAPPLPVPFDENAPQGPISEKGKARQRTTAMLFKAIEDQKLDAVIGRSADFYGPGAVNSSTYISFLERMLQGKTPQTLSNPNVPHTYANVEDNGRALVELALNEDCYGQAWHLPVGPPITTNGLLDIFNKVLGTDFKVSVMPTFLRKILALFIPPLKEVGEMLYQFEQEYVMSYEKFKKRFPDFEVTTYQKGIEDMVAWFRANSNEQKNL